MTALATLRRPILPRALVLGALCGAALVLVGVFSSRGPLIFFPYAGLFIALAALVAHHRKEPFVLRFGACLLSFTLATLITWLYIVVFVNPPALHAPVLQSAWHLGVVLGVGAVLSAAVAYVTE